MIKDYGHLLARDRGYAERAAEMSGLARDITEFLYELGLLPPLAWTSLRVAYHSACSLQHGQGLTRCRAGCSSKPASPCVEIPEGHICCGSAGTYNLLEPELSRELRDRKLAQYRERQAGIVATGNIGCITQLQRGAAVPIVHTVELLDWATGGPMPEAARRAEIAGAPDPGPRRAGGAASARAATSKPHGCWSRSDAVEAAKVRLAPYSRSSELIP